MISKMKKSVYYTTYNNNNNKSLCLLNRIKRNKIIASLGNDSSSVFDESSKKNYSKRVKWIFEKKSAERWLATLDALFQYEINIILFIFLEYTKNGQFKFVM